MRRRLINKHRWTISYTFQLIILFILVVLTVFTALRLHKPHESQDTRSKAASAAKYSIYYDSLAPGWLEWSNASVNTGISTPVFSGNKAILYSPRNTNSKFYLHTNTSIDTSPYTILHFAIYSTQVNQKYGVLLEDQNQTNLSALIPLENFGALPPVNQWQVYDIPLQSLNAAGKKITGLEVQGVNGSGLVKTYLDELELRSLIATSTPQPTSLATPNPTPSPMPSVSPISGNWWKPTSIQPLHLHWQLSQDFVYPRDMVAGTNVYDVDGEITSADTVRAIKATGAKTICYIDVGVFETYRSDANKFPGSYTKNNQIVQNPYTGDPQYANVDIIGNADIGWGGSYWLDIRRQDILRPIMEARIRDWCYAKGFDAVEPDESEVWNNKPGFPITLSQSISYSKMIADIVHSYGMSVGLKGNNGEAAYFEPFSDWSLSEECYQYNECDNLSNAFASKNKAVFIVEYQKAPNCLDANSKHMNAMMRDLNLMGPTSSSYVYQPCIPNSQNNW